MTSSTRPLKAVCTTHNSAQKSPFANYFENWASYLSALFKSSMMQPRELRVWKTANHQGRVLWNAYDPMTGKTINKVSESDLRVWIESRYC